MYTDLSSDINKEIMKGETKKMAKWKCTVCGYIHEGEMTDKVVRLFPKCA